VTARDGDCGVMDEELAGEDDSENGGAEGASNLLDDAGRGARVGSLVAWYVLGRRLP
jgi:hypothetical protein